MEQQIPGLSGKDLQDEFQEYSASQPGGELLQISNASGEWIFQSPSIQKVNIPPGLPSGEGNPSSGMLQTLGLLRVISAGIRLKGNIYKVQIATDLSKFNLFSATAEMASFDFNSCGHRPGFSWGILAKRPRSAAGEENHRTGEINWR